MGNFCIDCACIRKEEKEMVHDFFNGNVSDNKIRINNDDNDNDNEIFPVKNESKVKAKYSTNTVSTPYINSNYIISNKHDSGPSKTEALLIQSNYRGHFFRKHYEDSIKVFLKQIESTLIKETIDSYKNSIIRQAEANCLMQFDIHNWKQFYHENDNTTLSIITRDYDKIYQASLLLTHENSMSSCYIGQVNITTNRHGKGKLIINQGDQYEGRWNNNVFEGWGRHIDTEGNIYEGLFIDGDLTGKGLKITLNNWKYAGDFLLSLREGEGIEETDDHIYEGHFAQDKKNGRGKVCYKQTCDTYEGEFIDNEITGIGNYCWGTGHKYTGTFIKGKMHGYGKYNWAKGGEYEGEYLNGIKQGKGTFRWTDGRVFNGPFVNGKPNGQGKLILSGNEYDVEFVNCKLKKSIQEIEEEKINKLTIETIL